MAFTTEQKKKILERAEQLIAAEGISKGAAAQRAVKELFSPEEISAAFPVSPAPAPVKPVVEEKPPEIVKTDLELEGAERSYRNERKAILKEQGITGAEADKLIAGELEGFRRPAPLGFGDVAERESGGVVAPVEKAAEALGVGPAKTAVLPSAPVGINYDELAKVWADSYGVPFDQAKDEVAIFRANVIEPKINKAKEEGLDDIKAQEKALKESLDVIEDINKRLSDKETYLQPEKVGSQDPWIRAFSPQVELGEGVPDLTEEQQVFLNAIEQKKLEKEVLSRRGEKKQVIQLANGSQLAYDPKQPLRTLPKGATIVSVEKTPQEIRAEIEKEAPIPWWIDPEKSKAIKADPTKFEEKGLFSTETPYGTKKETTAAWLLRGAMAPFNALAGATSKAAYDFGPLAEAREEERKEKGFDSAILLNVAENRGYMGEAQSAADLAKVKTTGEYLGPLLYGTTLAGGFAADLLDPSLDIAKAAGIVGRSAVRGYKGLGATYKNLSRAEKGSKALEDAFKLGANDFIDNALGADVFARGKRFEVGDVRGLVARNIAEDFSTASALAANKGDDATAAFDALSPSQKSSAFGKQYRETIANAGKDAKVDDVLTIMDDVYTSGSPTKKAIDISTELDAYASGAQRGLKAIRRKDLARSLGSLASVDDEAKALMEGVAGTDKMVKALKDSAPASYERLKKILLFDEASKQAARTSIDPILSGAPLENIVAITRNTWAGKAVSKKILERAKQSPIGKVASELNDVELIVAPRSQRQDPNILGLPIEAAPSVMPAYKLTDEQADLLNNIVEELRTYNKIDNNTASTITNLLVDKRRITTENLRALLDANIDLIAEGLAAGGSAGVSRARDLARLPVQEQMEYLVPLERRTLAREVYKNISEKLLGGKPIKGNLSIGQRQLVNKAQQDISTLDQKLRKELKAIVEDPKMQELYGITDPIDYQVGLGRLIIGPEPSKEKVRKVLESVLNDMFYAKQTKENAFDILTGTSVGTNTGVFTSKGMLALNPAMNKAVDNIYNSPDLFWKETEELLREASNLVSQGRTDAKGLDVLAYPKEDIINVLNKTNGKIPAEVQATAYYRSEAEKIAEETFNDLINTEIGRGKLTITDELDKDAMDKLVEQSRKISPGLPQLSVAEGVQTQAVLNRAKKQLQGKPQGEITVEDIAEIFYGDQGAFIQFQKEKAAKVNKLRQDLNVLNVTKSNLEKTNQVVPSSLIDEINRKTRDINDVQSVGMPNKGTKEYARLSAEGANEVRNQAATLIADKDFMEAFQPYFEVAEDVAANIIRRNGLSKTDVDIRKLDDLFNRAISPDSPEYIQLNLLFGEDLAGQLRADLAKSYEDTRKQLVDLLDKKYSGNITEQGVNKLGELKDKLEELRYLFILNTRPRFHGPNLLTGAEIVYSTTGRIVSPVDLWEGAQVLKNTTPTQVMFRDAAGRAYTSGELNQLLDTTGRSVYSSTKPAAQQKAIADLLESKPNTWSDKIRGNIEAFKDLPQSEDLLFRYAVLKQALQEGRSVDDALQLARASMFDLGDIAKAEENIRRLALFYGFQRNSLINAINNLGSAKGLKRLVKTKRTRDNLSRFFTSDEDREYAPSYAQSRVLLGKLGFDFDKGKDLLITSPPLQGLDAIYSLADFMKGDMSGLFGDALRPEYKTAFGVDDKFSKELDAVPQEHINILKLKTDAPEEAINFILAGFGAEPTSSYKNKNGITIVPLNTPKQKAAYKKFMDAMSMVGVSTLGIDVSRTLAPGGTKVGEMGEAGRGAFAIGAATPMTTFTPAKQAYYDRISRLAELNKAIKSMKDTGIQKAQAKETIKEEEARKGIKDVQEQKKDIVTDVMSNLPKEVRTDIQIAEDMNKAMMDYAMGKISYAKLEDELEKLDAELVDLQNK